MGQTTRVLVSSWRQVEKNIRTLEAARVSNDPELRKAYISLIRKGTCFVPYESSLGLSFAPSRFVGYVDNGVREHLSDLTGVDGRVTNEALDSVLGLKCLPSPRADHEYQSFCSKLGFAANPRGNFGVIRKFWTEREDTSDWDDRDEIAKIEQDESLTPTEKKQLTIARLGQGKFRHGVVSVWQKCCLTGVAKRDLLRASHIKPWRASDNRERLDRFNGLLLTPTGDALFDHGYITFSGSGELVLSSELLPPDRKSLVQTFSRKIELCSEHLPYMDYHRRHIFKR